MKRPANLHLSASGECALAQYEQTLRGQEDLAPASRRNYLNDVRHFMTWYEAYRAEQAASAQGESGVDPQAVTIPNLTRYRTYLQTVQKQRPASVNRALISLERYFGWAIRTHLIAYDPSAAVKLVGQEGTTPRQLDDQEEQALVAAVTKRGTLRDRVLIVLLLHTGLRAREVCRLRRDQVKLGKRSGFLEVIGKRNKYREVPLNATARKALEEYLPTLSPETLFLFPSGKTKEALSNVPWAISSKNMRPPQNCSM
jgi:integrase/recombinase XerD